MWNGNTPSALYSLSAVDVAVLSCAGLVSLVELLEVLDEGDDGGRCDETSNSLNTSIAVAICVWL